MVDWVEDGLRREVVVAIDLGDGVRVEDHLRGLLQAALGVCLVSSLAFLRQPRMSEITVDRRRGAHGAFRAVLLVALLGSVEVGVVAGIAFKIVVGF